MKAILFALGSSVLLAACASSPDNDAEVAADEIKLEVTQEQRANYVRSARIWDEAEFRQLATKDLRRGPQTGERAVAPGEEIVCKFVEPSKEKEMGGMSEKFQCGPCELTAAEISAGKKPCTVTEKRKVKYSGIGRPAAETNPAQLAAWDAEDVREGGEVFAEVLGTRLMWALGFYADRVFPVRVHCYGCPEKPWDAYKEFPKQAGGERADRRFSFALIESKHPGEKIEAVEDQGFDWKETALIDEPSGGAPRAHVDAFRLLAAFMYHTDNKPANQRLFCAKDGVRANGTCSQPRVMIQDIGGSFGRQGNLLDGFRVQKAELGDWSREPLWKSHPECQANLSTSSSDRSLRDPIVSEEGRAFLARLMDPAVLTDEHLAAIFEASRVIERREKINGREVTIADWVAAFNAKRADLARACGSSGR